MTNHAQITFDTTIYLYFPQEFEDSKLCTIWDQI